MTRSPTAKAGAALPAGFAAGGAGRTGGLRRGSGAGDRIGARRALARRVLLLVAAGLGIAVAARDVELLNIFLRDLLDKAGDTICRRAAEEHTLAGTRENEVLARAGERDVAEAALLLHLVRLADAAQAGENTLLAADDEHRRKLQALGRVHGHERDAVHGLVVVIEVGIERDLVEESRERGIIGLL